MFFNHLDLALYDGNTMNAGKYSPSESQWLFQVFKTWSTSELWAQHFAKTVLWSFQVMDETKKHVEKYEGWSFSAHTPL